MKKTFLFAIVLLVILTSCNFEIPEKITIKTSPSINVSAGTADFKLEEIVSVEKIKEMIAGNSEDSSEENSMNNLNVMEYNPSSENSDVMKFLIHYPLETVSLDIREQINQIKDSLTNISFGESLGNTATSIEIPEISSSIEQTVSVNLTSELINQVNSQLKPIVISGPNGTEIIPELGTTQKLPIGYNPNRWEDTNDDSIFDNIKEGTEPIGYISLELKDDDDNVLLDNVIFGSNSGINIKFDQIVGSDETYCVQIENIRLMDNTGTVITESSSVVTVTDSDEEKRTLFFDLSNKALPTVVYLFLDVSVSGGKMDLTDPFNPKINLHKTVAYVNISPSTKIVSAEGFNLENSIIENIENTSIDLSTMEGLDALKEATIENGNINVKFNIPNFDKWQGFETKVDLILLQEDGLNIQLTDQSFDKDMQINIPIQNQKINTNRIDINGNIEFSVTNTDDVRSKIVLDDSEILDISVGAEIKIDKFSYATIKIPQETANYLNQQIKVEVPEDLKSWIKQIDFSKLGVDFKLKFGMPEENPIKIIVSSQAFGLTEEKVKELNFVRGTNETTEIDSETGLEYPVITDSFSINDFSIILKDLPVDNETQKQIFDFNVEVVLPNQEKVNEDTYVTLKNIQSGLLQFEVLDVAPLLEWSKVVVCPDTQTGSFSGTFPELTDENGNPVNGIDLSELGNILEGLELPQIVGNIYLSTSSEVLEEKFKEANFVAKIGYTLSDGDSIEYLLNTEEGSDFGFVKKPVFDKNTTKYTDELPKASVTIDTFDKILNAHPKNLRLNYDISINEITINQQDLDSLGDNIAEFNIDVVLILPLQLNILEGTEAAYIDLSKYLYASKDEEGNVEEDAPRKDLLNREEPTSIDDIKQYINDASVKMLIKYENRLGIDCSLSIDDSDNSGFSKKITLSKNEGLQNESIKLTLSEMEKILSTYPFAPDLKISINDDIVIPPFAQEPGIKVTLIMGANVDVDYTIDINDIKQNDDEE